MLTYKNVQIVSIKDFIEKFHPTLTPQSVKAALDKGKLDYIQPERDIFIMLTPRTLNYMPKNYGSKIR